MGAAEEGGPTQSGSVRHDRRTGTSFRPRYHPLTEAYYKPPALVEQEFRTALATLGVGERLGRREIEPILSGILGDDHCRKNHRHVLAGFPRQDSGRLAELPEVRFPGALPLPIFVNGPEYLDGVPQPLKWLLSVLDFRATEGRDLPYTIDQEAYKPLGFTPGPDTLYGNGGRDKLFGGPDADRLLGGIDQDVINSRGGGRDVVDCGVGRHDVAKIDRSDKVRRCEAVLRPAKKK